MNSFPICVVKKGQRSLPAAAQCLVIALMPYAMAYLNLDTSKNLKAFTDADVLPSAMLSPAATDLQDMIRREAELYLIGEKDLDTMIQDCRDATQGDH